MRGYAHKANNKTKGITGNMYTPDSIQRVKDLAAADFIGRRIKMSRAGSKWKAHCPFHDEKTPSFTVDPAKNTWTCYGGCGGGDLINFIEKYDNLQFIDAVKLLADEAGLILYEENDNRSPEERQQQKDEKEAMYGLMEWACQLYQDNLDPERREMLYARGVTDEDISKWRIGYAADAWRTITSVVAGNGKLPLAVKLDLVKEKSEGQDVKYYDTFRNRIMLPVCDDRGRVIGFGAWAITPEDKKTAKYLNSKETPLYQKSHALYGIEHAKAEIVKTKKAQMTEGYFDVITCHRAGMLNVVASSGTALTAEHLQVLRKWSIEQVILIYDKDSNKAGEKAAMRGVDMVLEAGMLPSVVTWEEDVKDIDELLRK